MNHVVVTLPGLLKSTLASSLSQGSGSPLSISEVLKDTISAYDDALTKDLFDIFPGGVDEISRLSDEEIDKIVNDSEQGGSNWAKVLRCMHGSTVLISLIDPSKENIWVASLGDCQAGRHFKLALATRNSTSFYIALGTFKGTESWNPLILSTDHNAKADAEVARIREEHPGESECILNDRVLGAIAVTRGSFSFTTCLSLFNDNYYQLWAIMNLKLLYRGPRVCSKMRSPHLNSLQLQLTCSHHVSSLPLTFLT